MAEILLNEENFPIYPGIPHREDIKIYEDDVDNCYKIYDKESNELIICIPNQTEL